MKADWFAKGIRGSAFLLAAVAVLALGAGCSRESKRARHQERADRYFAAEDFTRAEIEYKNVLRLDRTNRVAIKRLGQIYFQRGGIPDAFQLLRVSAQLEPGDPDVHTKLGVCYLVIGSNNTARAEALKALGVDPGNEEAFLLLADAAQSPKEIQETQQQLEKLRPKSGGTAGFHLALGSLALEQQDLKAAEAAFTQALRLDPKSSGAHSAMGRLRFLQGDTAQAEQSLKAAAELAPIRSARRIKYAEFKIRNGDLAGARQVLENITKKAPDYSSAWVRLAEISLAEKKLGDAETLLGRVLAQDPRNYEASLLNARLKLAKGDRAKALADFEKVVQWYPRSPQAQYELAATQLANGDPAKAAASLKQAITLNPNHAEAVILLAELNLRKGEAAAAVAALTDLVKKQPRLAQAQLSLANAYRAQKNPDAALAVYRHLAELAPKNPQPQVLMGLLLRDEKKPVEARTALEKAAQLAPDDPRIVEQLVGLDIAEKRFPAALQRVQALSGKYPKSAGPQILLAEIFLAQGNTNQAEVALEKALSLQPDARSPYLTLAQIYVNTGKQAQALEKLRAVVKANPKDIPALMLMAMIEEKSGNHSAARDSYEKVLAANPRFSPALNNLAYLYSEYLGQLDLAYDRATKAREVEPQNPSVADTLGWILYKRGDYPWALNHLEESAEKLTTEPEVLYHLGMAHYMMGDEAAARSALQQAVAPKREFPGQAEANQCLGILALDASQSAENTIRPLEERLEKQPGDPVAFSRLAALYRRSGAQEKAIRVGERALKANPKAAVIPIVLADLYSRQPQGREKAMDLAKRARSLAPEDAHVAHLLGRLAYQMADYKWALSLLQESARKAPGNAETLYDLGLAYASVGRLDTAETTMQDVLKATPPAPIAEGARRFLAMAAVCRKPASAAESATQVQQALQADPTLAPALLAAALIHEQQGKLPEAKQTYESLAGRYPFFSPAIRRLTILEVESFGNDTKGYEWGTKAREMEPDDGEVAQALGIATCRRKDYSRAAQLLKESVAKGTAHAEAYFYLGVACQQLKRTAEAKEYLTKALSLGPNARFAAQAREALAQLK
jgi:tetratricopeptide (TPR) repeat protein